MREATTHAAITLFVGGRSVAHLQQMAMQQDIPLHVIPA